MKYCILFFNGELRGSKEFYQNFISDYKSDIFCADGGANLCKDLDLIPKEIWGDLDSISDENLSYFKNNNVIIKKFPKEKDFTDSELILNYLEEKNYKNIFCIGALGGSIDHELTNINLLFKYKNLTFLSEEENLFKINENIDGKKGIIFKESKDKKISFIIFSEKIENLTLSGFKYNVENKNFERGYSTLISNVIKENPAKVTFDSGELLCSIKNEK